MIKKNKGYILLMFFTSILILIGMLNTLTVKAESTNPEPTRNFFYDDYAGILTQSTKDKVMKQSKIFNNYPTQPQVVLMTVNSTGSNSIDDYADALIDNSRWQAGKQGYDNGTIIIWAKNQGKNNVRIQVGYGLEETLTDSKSSEILHKHYNDLKSSNTSKINKGLQGVYADVSKVITKKYSNLSKEQAKKELADKKRYKIVKIIVFIIVGVIILIIIIIIIVYFGDDGNGGSGFNSGGGYDDYSSSDFGGSSDGFFDGGFSAGGGGFGGGGASI